MSLLLLLFVQSENYTNAGERKLYERITNMAASNQADDGRVGNPVCRRRSTNNCKYLPLDQPEETPIWQ